jgi:hypothetical protein
MGPTSRTARNFVYQPFCEESLFESGWKAPGIASGAGF